MERTGRISKLYLIILLFSMIAITMSGCVYVNNKNWDDMTPEEQEEVYHTSTRYARADTTV